MGLAFAMLIAYLPLFLWIGKEIQDQSNESNKTH